jgi:hypothetical protein
MALVVSPISFIDAVKALSLSLLDLAEASLLPCSTSEAGSWFVRHFSTAVLDFS